MTDPIDALFGNPDDASAQASGQKSEGGRLREQLEQVLAQNRELAAQVQAQAARERERAVGELFSKHKIPDPAKDFFQGEPTDEAATAFVEKYGAMWGASSATATTPPAQQAQTTAMQQFTSTAPDATLDLPAGDEAAARALFATATSREDVLRTLREAGAAIG